MVLKKSLFALVSAVVAATSTAIAQPPKRALSPAEIIAASEPSDWRALSQSDLLYIALEHGQVAIELQPVLAHAHVERIRALANAGFYDGLSFYRVIDGFVAQGGDGFETRDVSDIGALDGEFDQPIPDDLPITSTGEVDGYAAHSGGAVGYYRSHPIAYSIEHNAMWGLHCTGAMAMARDNAPNTAMTEFYITLQPHRYLDRNLTVFGRVVDGMEHIQRLRRVTSPSGTTAPDHDRGDVIVSMRMGDELDSEQQRRLEILDTARPRFQQFLDARRNRPEDFFVYRPDYIDVCQVAIPVRERVRKEARP